MRIYAQDNVYIIGDKMNERLGGGPNACHLSLSLSAVLTCCLCGVGTSRPAP